MKLSENILAVLVLYKTKLDDSKTFLSLTQSLQANDIRLSLLVYDNSPEFNSNLQVNCPNWDITYIPDVNNSGVSKAYNIGADIAYKTGKDWVILFDQDTVFPENAINEYIKEINNYPDHKLFAPVMKISSGTIISPCYFNFMRGSSLRAINPGVNNLDKLSIINCGICINVAAFKKNEGYNELIKLDFSDHDFIKRFKKNIANKFVVLNLEVCHELSSSTRNSKQSDLTRFDYYVNGARYIPSSFTENIFSKFNVFFRALKLTLIHKDFSFIAKILLAVFCLLYF